MGLNFKLWLRLGRPQVSIAWTLEMYGVARVCVQGSDVLRVGLGFVARSCRSLLLALGMVLIDAQVGINTAGVGLARPKAGPRAGRASASPILPLTMSSSYALRWASPPPCLPQLCPEVAIPTPLSTPAIGRT